MAIGRIPEPGTGIPESIIAAKGDLIVGTANDVPGILSVGTNGHTLVAKSSEATGLVWQVDPVADVITTAGDLLYGTAADTVARLGIGTAGQVLTVNSGATAPEWAAAAGGGGMTSIASGSLSGSSLSLTSISGSYKNLQLVLRDWENGSVGYLNMRLNNLSTSIYYYSAIVNQAGTASAIGSGGFVAQAICNYNSLQASVSDRFLIIDIFDYANTTANKNFQIQSDYTRATTAQEALWLYGHSKITSAIDRIDLILDTGTWAAGTYILYGVN